MAGDLGVKSPGELVAAIQANRKEISTLRSPYSLQLALPLRLTSVTRQRGEEYGARVWDRKFLGYSFRVAPGKKVKLRVAAKALKEMKQRVRLKQWKRGRTVYRELRRRDVPEWLAPRAARLARNWWKVAAHGALHTALPGSYFERLGVPRLAAETSTH